MLRIKFERQDQGLTQEQLGQLSGVNRNIVHLIERGRLNPTLRELSQLADALGVQPPSLLLRPVEVVRPEHEAVAEAR